MEIILLEQVHGLGTMGDTVTVKPGYARNFLIPQTKAIPATKANREKFEAQRAELEKDMKARIAAAEKLATKFEGVTITLERPASETGMLYGSIKPRDVENFLNDKGIEVEKSQVIIGEPIKMVGEHTVQVALHPEVILTVPVEVSRQSM